MPFPIICPCPRYVPALAVLAAGLLVLAAGCGPRLGAKGGAEPEGKARPDHSLSAEQLVADYQDNEVAANRKYKGKTLLVWGAVASVSDAEQGATARFFGNFLAQAEDFNGHPRLPGAEVVCRFPATRKGEAARLRRRGSAEVVGVCLGREPGGVGLAECRLHSAPSKAHPSIAEAGVRGTARSDK